MSEKVKILYEKAEEKVSYVETRICQLNKGTDLQQVVRLLTDARNLEYHFDSTGMNRAAIEKCKALQVKIIKIQEDAVAKAESFILQPWRSVFKSPQHHGIF